MKVQHQDTNSSPHKSKYLLHYLKIKKTAPQQEYLPTLEMLEEEYINYVMELTGNDLAGSAEILNISPLNLLNKIKRLELRF